MFSVTILIYIVVSICICIKLQDESYDVNQAEMHGIAQRKMIDVHPDEIVIEEMVAEHPAHSMPLGDDNIERNIYENVDTIEPINK